MPERPAPTTLQTDVAQRELHIVTDDGVILAGEQAGEGPPIVLTHGLTATRRYLVMGSSALQRSGFRVIAYDARGHGQSTPASGPGAYGYERLAADLLTVLDATGAQRALLAGASMGAHTAVRFALEHPDRVAALAIITPAFDPTLADGGMDLPGWDALARGLREGGVEGFVGAYHLELVPASLRPTIETVLRQRLALHAYPNAVADALEGVPRSRPFDTLEQLATIAVPTVVVASRDEADPSHPLAIGQLYARTIPGAQLRVEDEGPPMRSPLAWQGAQLSRIIAELAARAGHAPGTDNT
jgi:pimeloyl-ACP methyl ester carboxylesterase